MKKNILAPSPQKYSWGWVPAHCIPFVVLREKKTKTLESNPFNIQRLWGLTLPQLFKKTGETKRGVFSDLGNFMSSTKFTLRSELFLVLKFYFKESLLSKKKSHRNPLTKITNYTTFPNPRVQRRNEALQFPSWWGHSHHLDYHPKSWDPPTSNGQVIGGQTGRKVMEGPTSWKILIPEMGCWDPTSSHVFCCFLFWRCFLECFGIEEIVVHFFGEEVSQLQHVVNFFWLKNENSHVFQKAMDGNCLLNKWRRCFVQRRNFWTKRPKVRLATFWPQIKTRIHKPSTSRKIWR